MEGLSLDADEHGVVVVAHPDDESLWFGGLLLTAPPQWTVVCCTVPRRDPVRADKFTEACRLLGVAKSFVLPFSEVEPIRFDQLNIGGFDIIVTHGRAGEYGHRQHQELHQFIAGTWPHKTICSAYGDKPTFTLELSDSQYERKLAALRAYDHCSPTDYGKPKWRALLDVYDGKFDLRREPYRRVSDA
jgi:LmbE family N-acetylglucosaminyl deacetylase